ncbi:MAG: hypothetical protein IKG39_11940 [Lachnospiraceae bacterium]|nr:hypothetical protein [Lachnospiraceae bacterium]
MKSKNKKTVKRISLLFLTILLVVTSSGVMSLVASAEAGTMQINGFVYEFKKNNDYMYSNAEEYVQTSDGAETVGSFTVGGNISSVTEIMGVPYLLIERGNLDITYSYSDSVGEETDGWVIANDKEKIIDDIKLSGSIGKGTILLQTSRDGKIWNTVVERTNVFENTPACTEPLYTTSDVELQNGCYYRLIVAYEKQKRTGKSSLFGIINLGDKYEYARYAEVYIFCACDREVAEQVADTNTLKYSFDDRVKVKNDSGYAQIVEMDKDDPHYGWSLGEFIIEGFTRQSVDDNGNVIFLFNPEDNMRMHFNLKEYLDALNGDSSLSIEDDDKGYDLGFEVAETDMGRGTLIVQYTDYENKRKPLVLFKDYLSACVSAQADTVVQIQEEGDYEVTLDYKVKKKNIMNTDIFPTINSYKITFKFSVRNGNCMVYPLDVLTGSELTNSSFTENGFFIDMARSKYLEINVKKETLNNQGTELVEDTRFNKPAKAGDKYIDEGVYTLTVRNKYTNQETVKVIYVGHQNILKAYVTTGLPVVEISDMVSRGATIDDTGTIDSTSMKGNPAKTDTTADDAQSGGKINVFMIIIPAIVIIIVIVIALVAFRRKKKSSDEQEEE